MKFRKKPVVIEAVKWLGNREEMKSFVGDLATIDGGVSIPTLEGTMVAAHGDWVIKGIKGEFYPCKPDIFEATYEPVTESPKTE